MQVFDAGDTDNIASAGFGCINALKAHVSFYEADFCLATFALYVENYNRLASAGLAARNSADAYNAEI
jgi:hypothetical protein